MQCSFLGDTLLSADHGLRNGGILGRCSSDLHEQPIQHYHVYAEMSDDNRAPRTFDSHEQHACSTDGIPPSPSMVKAETSDRLNLGGIEEFPPHGSVSTDLGCFYIPESKNAFAARYGYGHWSAFLRAHCLSPWEDRDI